MATSQEQLDFGFLDDLPPIGAEDLSLADPTLGHEELALTAMDFPPLIGTVTQPDEATSDA